MPQNIALDRLVRKETSLGFIRELVPPTDHIGTELLAPWLDVPTDEVIFDYAKGLTDGLAPARAEDAESELAQKDESFVGSGRASIIDWALKDHYSASDVTRYREALLIAEATRDTLSLPLTVTSMVEGFLDRVARDTRLRRRKLDNRVEWMIMQSLETGGIVYNDGKIKFTIDYGRPAGQTNQAPAGGLFSLTTSDPIRAFTEMQQTMFDTYGVRIDRGITSRRVLNSLLNSDRFAARSGLVGSASTPVDPKYLIDGWGPTAAQQVIERATGITLIEYDAVYRTRPVGSNVVTNNRFLSDNKIFFLPSEGDIANFDDTEIGFAKTLTAPHPEGNWTPGFYEFEYETRDPWGYNVGTGTKAFPVFLHLDKTFTMTVL